MCLASCGLIQMVVNPNVKPDDTTWHRKVDIYTLVTPVDVHRGPPYTFGRREKALGPLEVVLALKAGRALCGNVWMAFQDGPQ